MCNFGHISVVSAPSGRGAQGSLAHPACLFPYSVTKRTLLATESPSSSELVFSPSGCGSQGSLAHPACSDYRSRYPKALFLAAESPSSSELVSSPSGSGAQGSLAHPACLDYRSRYPQALFGNGISELLGARLLALGPWRAGLPCSPRSPGLPF